MARCAVSENTHAALLRKLERLVKADDHIEELKAKRASGSYIIYQTAWRGAYLAREKAALDLWGNHADDRAQAARELLAALRAPRVRIHVPVRPEAQALLDNGGQAWIDSLTDLDASD